MYSAHLYICAYSTMIQLLPHCEMLYSIPSICNNAGLKQIIIGVRSLWWHSRIIILVSITRYIILWGNFCIQMSVKVIKCTSITRINLKISETVA